MLLSKDTLLLVGDAQSDRAQLRAIFQQSYHLLEAENADQAVLLLNQNGSCIAAILMDLPIGNGETLRRLVDASKAQPAGEVPILVLITPISTGEREEFAFLLGASDVIKKPYTSITIQNRLQVILDMYQHRWNLEALVKEQTETIRHSNQVMLDALSSIIEQRSTESGNHVLRIRRFTKILLTDVAKSCPEYQLDDVQIDAIASAASLHDIGKIGIPDGILNKPGPLTQEEFETMKTHTTIGSQLVQRLDGLGDVTFLRYAYNIARYHHERWDGKGYPEGLAGNDIPIAAQVVGLADSFDALTTPRAYKAAIPCQEAISMILNGECGLFSPKLLLSLKNVQQEFISLAHQYADGYSPKDDRITAPLPGPVSTHYAMDAQQLAQVKYETLLHHMNDTVIELDVDSNIYHVVYNPNPDFEFLFSNATYWDLIRNLTRELVHPEDVAVLSRHPHRSIEALFRNGERKRTFRYRILTPSKGIYTPYEVTLLRVETGNPEQRILLTILHRLPEHQALLSGPHRPPENPSTADLSCPLLRCLLDDKFTIQHGVKGLYPLTGFRPEEIVLQFSSSLLALVVPQDRPALLDSVREAARHGTKSEAEYRLLSKNGPPVWVLGKTRLLTGSDGQEYYYHSLTNISTSKEKQKKLEATAHREHLLLELSEAVTFEWDLLADRVTCSHRWEERFGYPPMTVDFSNQLSVASHFHPDDLAQVREKLYDLLHGTPSITVDVRIANQQGKYLWNQIRATTLSDLYGKPERIIGTITDVDELKRMALQMRQRADQDALTHLLNKASAQRYVSSYLSACPPGEKAGFLILDLDNFKLVNDRYGHMYGDALLTQLGYTLRKLFRSQDLIGRVGGDEFIVLLKNIPHASLLLTRCSLLVSELRELLKKLMPELNVTCSIGCAIYPDHGQTYAELFQHADRALYAAKSQGKDQYILYDPLALYPSQADQPLPSRVDSDEEPTLNDASLTRYVFSRLYESRDICTTIDELLAFIGAHFNVSRAYIFENNEDNTTCANTFEWCNVGISPEKEHLKCLSYADDLPNLRSLYNEREVFYVSDISTLPRPMRAVLEPQGIKSMLHCAILDAGVFRGYVGFDACADNRLWTEVQVETLEFLAKALSAFLLKQRTAEKAAKAAQDRTEEESN